MPGGLELDLSTHQVRFGRHQPSLTGIEFRMLEILLQPCAGVRIETIRGVGYRIVSA